MRAPKSRFLKYCLANLNPQDRFGMMHFASTVNKYADNLWMACGAMCTEFADSADLSLIHIPYATCAQGSGRHAYPFNTCSRTR